MNKFRRLSSQTHNPLSSSQRASKSSWVVIVAMVAFTTFSALIFLLYQGNGAFLLQSNTGATDSSPSTIGAVALEQSSATLRGSTALRSESSVIPKVLASSDSRAIVSSASEAPQEVLKEALKEASQEASEQSTLEIIKPLATLVSLNKPVISDVRGNLGPPTVVTNEDVADWLKDRWQAARNMQGEPIPGEHWLEIDLGSVFEVEKILIDWEQAYSDQWTIVGRRADNTEWTTMAVAGGAKTIEKNSKHVVQEVSLPADAEFSKLNCRYVRLIIHRSSTMWGSSVWRFQVWGRPGHLMSAQELARMERKRHERPVFRIKKAQH